MREPKDRRSLDRLPATQLSKVSEEHIWRSVQRLCDGYADHQFGPSTDYDVIAATGERLPPMAVFGVAASEALGFEVLPRHFSGGENTLCFRSIRKAGYETCPKGQSPQPAALPIDPEDRIWTEGNKRLVAHLKRERATGLAPAKRARFVREHGKLFCERCGVDPKATYGAEFGDACIEVHHEATPISEMGKDHHTEFDDLKCLCANCHRIVHAELRGSVLAVEQDPDE